MKILNIIKDKWNGFVLDRLHKQIINGTEKYINKKNSLKKWIPGKDWVQYSGPNFNLLDNPNFIFTASLTTLFVTKLVPLLGDSWLNNIPLEINILYAFL